MTKLSYETQAAHAPGKRPYAITRGGGAGIGRYAQTWSGDNETAWKTLRFNLTQGLNMSLSGMFNIGHDVGGFHGPSPEPGAVLPLRRVLLALAALRDEFLEGRRRRQPALDASGACCRRCASAIDAPLPADALSLHADVARDAATRAVVRPLFYDFPDDPAARDVEDAFMLGPDLLVAPVLEEGRRERRSICRSIPAAGTTGTTARISPAADGDRRGAARAPAALRPRRRDRPVGDPTGTAGPARATGLWTVGEAAGELYEDDGDTATGARGRGSS